MIKAFEAKLVEVVATGGNPCVGMRGVQAGHHILVNMGGGDADLMRIPLSREAYEQIALTPIGSMIRVSLKPIKAKEEAAS